MTAEELPDMYRGRRGVRLRAATIRLPLAVMPCRQDSIRTGPGR